MTTTETRSPKPTKVIRAYVPEWVRLANAMIDRMEQSSTNRWAMEYFEQFAQEVIGDNGSWGPAYSTALYSLEREGVITCWCKPGSIRAVIEIEFNGVPKKVKPLHEQPPTSLIRLIDEASSHLRRRLDKVDV